MFERTISGNHLSERPRRSPPEPEDPKRWLFCSLFWLSCCSQAWDLRCTSFGLWPLSCSSFGWSALLSDGERARVVGASSAGDSCSSHVVTHQLVVTL